MSHSRSARAARAPVRERSSAIAALAAVLLLVAAALYFGLFAAFSGTEPHAYASGRAPATVALTAGRTYQLSVRGGAAALAARGISVEQPQCSWSSGAGAVHSLHLDVLPGDSRSINVVGTFAAPASGRLHISCARWGEVFVDDADNAGFDSSGLFLVLGSAALLAGLALGLGVLYRRDAARRSTPASPPPSPFAPR